MSKLTLPTDSTKRKEYPLMRGCLMYFPAALAGVAKHSKLGSLKHNVGEEMHHARGKSGDHADCIIRHLLDIADLLAALERAGTCAYDPTGVLAEANALAWRALALSQELHEKYGDAPLAPGAKLGIVLPTKDEVAKLGVSRALDELITRVKRESIESFDVGPESNEVPQCRWCMVPDDANHAVGCPGAPT